MFGGALVLTARLIPARFLVVGALGFAAGIPFALVLRTGTPLPFFHLEEVEDAATGPRPSAGEEGEQIR
jgi:hypothetical protein